MKFPYKKLPTVSSDAFPKRAYEYRPIIPITVEYGKTKRKIRFEALLDSGSDLNIFPAWCGEIIGIDVESGPYHYFSGIGGGNFVAYFHDVTLHIGEYKIKSLCGFSPHLSQLASYGALGHDDFFKKFIVLFDSNNLEVTLKKNQ